MSDLELALAYLDSDKWIQFDQHLKEKCNNLAHDVCDALGINSLKLWGPKQNQGEVDRYFKAVHALLGGE